ncbi:MAG: tetratricopeptide repeat protein [Betaproteobacteria bacterium]|nr:tetratricopeptide repeat protein [Betaproteobacteria bacterium]
MKAIKPSAFHKHMFTVWMVVGAALCSSATLGIVAAPEAHAEVALSAKAATKSKKAPSAKPVASQFASPTWTPAFPALFKSPLNPARTYYIDVVGTDASVLDGFTPGRQAAATRAVQIRQMESEYKLQPAKSQQALNVGLKLVRLLEEQALYIENLRATGGLDQKYPDLNHYVKASRSQLVNVIDGLIRSFPKNDRLPSLRATQLVSRMKAGDPTAREEALRFVGSGRNTDQQRVALTGIMLDFESGRSSSPFGNLEFASQNASDSSARAAFRYFAGEAAFNRKQYSQASALYQEALKDMGRLKRIEGKAGPLLARVIYRLHQVSVLRDPLNVDAEAVASLQGAGAIDAARHYSEQVALNNVQKQPGRAAQIYADVQNLGDYSKSFNAYLELRILDIHLASRDLIMGQAQWQRVGKLGDVLDSVVPGRIFYTQNLALSQAQAKLDGENIARFVSLHDFFVQNYQVYAEREDWVIKVIELLWKARRANDVATRADALAGQTKNKEVLLTALRFSLRARESILGLSPEPKFVRSKKLGGDDQVAQAYVVTLDKMNGVAAGAELEQSVFQAAYVTHLLGQENPARQRFEGGLNSIPKTRLASDSVSFLLDGADSKKDWLYVEKIARLAMKLKIVPSKPVHRNLRVILENAVYSHAQQLSAQGQFEASANRFVAFQQEFPKHQSAATALDLAAKNFLQAKKTDSAVTQMESLLKSYPSSGYVKETTWQAAELSRGIAQFLRAAKHYEDFARKYSQEGAKRNAWLKSAEMHKSLGRFANAVSHYENHLAQVSSPSEKLRIAREIADIHFKFGRSAEAIAAYERMMKFISNSDDELYLRSQILLVQNRQGLEPQVRKTIARMLSLKPNSQDGFRHQAKAKFTLARLDAPAIRDRNIQDQKDLGKAVRTVASDYDRVKSLFLASCEVPGLEWCSAGYYETARLAEEVAKTLFAVELPPTLNPVEVNGIRTALTQTAERLQTDAKSFAAQAEQALDNGAPDAEMAERIRTYAQQMRGDSKENSGQQ